MPIKIKSSFERSDQVHAEESLREREFDRAPRPSIQIYFELIVLNPSNQGRSVGSGIIRKFTTSKSKYMVFSNEFGHLQIHTTSFNFSDRQTQQTLRSILENRHISSPYNVQTL